MPDPQPVWLLSADLRACVPLGSHLSSIVRFTRWNTLAGSLFSQMKRFCIKGGSVLAHGVRASTARGFVREIGARMGLYDLVEAAQLARGDVHLTIR